MSFYDILGFRSDRARFIKDVRIFKSEVLRGFKRILQVEAVQEGWSLA